MKRSRVVALAVCVLAATSAFARPQPIPIVNAGVFSPAQSSNPGGFVKSGALAFFAAADPSHGRELWATDGTSAGTRLVADIAPGAASSNPMIFPATLPGGIALVQTGSTTQSLWRSDGSAAGTYRLTTFDPIADPATFETQAVASGSLAFVFRHAQYAAAFDLWVTDGTANGTKRVGTYGWTPVATTVAASAGKVYFAVGDAVAGVQSWVSDGTLAGTHVIAQSAECPLGNCGSAPRGFFSLASGAYVYDDATLSKTDGTAAGTVAIGAAPKLRTNVLASGNIGYAITGQNVIWKTDGTTVTNGPQVAVSATPLTVLDDGRLVYFVPVANAQWELWVTDGTIANTTKAANLQFPPSSVDLAWLGAIGNQLFFAGYDVANGTELWTVSANGGTPALVTDIDSRVRNGAPLSSSPANGIVFGGKLLFAASSQSGRELWSTDGTFANTLQLANIAPDPNGGVLTGTIREQGTNAPLAGITVKMSCPGTTTPCSETVLTDANGAYRFDDIIPGQYFVSAGDNFVQYLSDAYDSAGCACTAGSPVTITANVQLSGADITLKKGGRIAGNVTRSIDGAAVDATIVISKPGTSLPVQSFAVHGTYRSIALPAGNYTVEAQNPTYGGKPMYWQRYDHHSCVNGTYSCAPADPLAVSLGSDRTAIDFPIQSRAVMSGTVRDASTGLPLPSAVIYVFSSSSPSYSIAQTSTLSDGTYSIALDAGSYYASAIPSGSVSSSYQPRTYPDVPCSSYPCNFAGATAIPLAVDGSATIDFSLPLAKTRVKGTLTDANGLPYSAVVTLVDASGAAVARGSSATNGTYFMEEVIPSGTYYVWVEDIVAPAIACAALPCSVAGATPFTVTAQQVNTLDVQTGAVLTRISGKLTDRSTGLPMANVFMALFASNGSSLNAILNMYSDSQGNYTASTHRTASPFYVAAVPNANYFTQYYPGVPECFCGGAAPPGATGFAPGIHDGADFSLPRVSAVTGRITDARTGRGVSGVRIVGVTSGSSNTTTSDSNGNYRLAVFKSGSYAVYTDVTTPSFAYQNMLYAGQSCGARCTSTASATLIPVADNQTVANIDFALLPLVPTGVITGRVTDAETAQPVANVLISATNPKGYTVSAITDAAGVYVINDMSATTGVLTGDYRLIAQGPSPFVRTLYGGTKCLDSACDMSLATVIHVDAPNTVTGADFALVKMHVTSIAPASGPAAGGTLVTIAGSNFSSESTVTIGGVAATIVSITSQQIVARTNAAPAGAAHVTVSTPSVVVSLLHAFFYFPAPPPGRHVARDFDGDGKSDLFWQNSATGETSAWLMNGINTPATFRSTTIPQTWSARAFGDFDGDGRADVFLRDSTTGETCVWLMNGAQFTTAVRTMTVPVAWDVIGSGDFDGDGKADLLWFNASTGETSVWLMNGTTVATAVRSTTVPLHWIPRLVADFDGDGKADIFWRNDSTGETCVWLMNGPQFASAARSITVPTVWDVAGAGDFDGDGKADVFWRNTSTGETSVWFMNGVAPSNTVRSTTVPLAWQAANFNDYDGDGKSDVFWSNSSTGETSIWLMNGGNFSTAVRSITVPTAWQVAR